MAIAWQEGLKPSAGTSVQEIYVDRVGDFAPRGGCVASDEDACSTKVIAVYLVEVPFTCSGPEASIAFLA